jgi:hypothetical protein
MVQAAAVPVKTASRRVGRAVVVAATMADCAVAVAGVAESGSWDLRVFAGNAWMGLQVLLRACNQHD